jgi:hypothetical protein
MHIKTGIRLFFFLALVEGLAALAVLLRVPSESGGLWGYSPARLAVAFLLLCGTGLAGFLLARALHWPTGAERLLARLDGFAAFPGHLFWISAALVFCVALCTLVYLFTYLVVPPHLRGSVVWAGLLSLQSLVLLGLRYREMYRSANFWQPLHALPRWSNLDREQRRVFGMLTLVGFVYFAAFAIPNAQGAHTLDELRRTSGDENITYPYVTWMLAPANTPAEAIYHWFIYEDYHYGYPFYLLSALTLLPARVIFGAGFADQVQMNMLVLRQVISVLPMILAALVMTYLQTRLRRMISALGLFLIILFIPQVVAYNIHFWHPDALVVLATALTLFFLDKDQFRYGINFYLAAVFCALAAGIKLWGFFFFLAVGGYLLVGWLRHHLAFRQAALRGALFVGVMAVMIILSNPFLLVPQARGRMAAIMNDLNQKVSVDLPGMEQPGADEYYRTGFEPGLKFLEVKYGSRWFLYFLVGSLLAQGIWGPRRTTAWLILGWMLPMAVTFLFILPYKSYHYWLPVMVPLYSGGFALAQVVFGQGWLLRQDRRYRLAGSLLIGLVILALAAQFIANLFSAAPDWHQWI